MTRLLLNIILLPVIIPLCLIATLGDLADAGYWAVMDWVGHK